MGQAVGLAVAGRLLQGLAFGRGRLCAVPVQRALCASQAPTSSGGLVNTINPIVSPGFFVFCCEHLCILFAPRQTVYRLYEVPGEIGAGVHCACARPPTPAHGSDAADGSALLHWQPPGAGTGDRAGHCWGSSQGSSPRDSDFRAQAGGASRLPRGSLAVL